jgi:hypothetical protein
MPDRVVRCLSFIPKQGTRAFPSDDPGRAWLRTSSSSHLSKLLCSKQLGVLETHSRSKVQSIMNCHHMMWLSSVYHVSPAKSQVLALV